MPTWRDVDKRIKTYDESMAGTTVSPILCRTPESVMAAYGKSSAEFRALAGAECAHLGDP